MRSYWVRFLLRERMKKLGRRYDLAHKRRHQAWETSSPNGSMWKHYKRMCDRYQNAIVETARQLNRVCE